MHTHIEPLALVDDEPRILQIAARLTYISTGRWGIDRLAAMVARGLLQRTRYEMPAGYSFPLTRYELTALGRASLAAAKAGLN